MSRGRIYAGSGCSSVNGSLKKTRPAPLVLVFDRLETGLEPVPQYFNGL